MRGAPAGDLYIFIAVSPHSLFTREGRDLYCRVPLPMVRAALGGPVEVPTLDGKRAVITVPAGTQTGHRFRLRGKGCRCCAPAAPVTSSCRRRWRPPSI